MYHLHSCQYWQKSDSNNDNHVESMHLILTNLLFLFCTGQGGKVAKGLSIANTLTTNVTTWATPGEWASSPGPTWGEYDSVELGYLFYSCSHCG